MVLWPQIAPLGEVGQKLQERCHSHAAGTILVDLSILHVPAVHLSLKPVVTTGRLVEHHVEPHF